MNHFWQAVLGMPHWLMPIHANDFDQSLGCWPDLGEIDLMEVSGLVDVSELMEEGEQRSAEGR